MATVYKFYKFSKLIPSCIIYSYNDNGCCSLNSWLHEKLLLIVRVDHKKSILFLIYMHHAMHTRHARYYIIMQYYSEESQIALKLFM